MEDRAISLKAVDELSRNLVHTTRDKADFLCEFWEGLKQLPSVNPHYCDTCEVGNPCLYCKHEFEPQERSEEVCQEKRQ